MRRATHEKITPVATSSQRSLSVKYTKIMEKIRLDNRPARITGTGRKGRIEAYAKPENRHDEDTAADP
jgi:hypothetical protein